MDEIRKRWLEEHLAEVEKVAREWFYQLNLGSPFYPPRDEKAWEMTYQSPIERDEEKNHILRRHLRSRTLWALHTKWEQQLRALTGLRKETLEEAKRLAEGKGQYWVFTALWQAFERAKNEPKSEDEEKGWEEKVRQYYRADTPPSPAVMFGAFAIAKADQVDQVGVAHLEVIRRLARLQSVQEAVRVGAEIEDLQRKMEEIGRHILKSHDILYPCRYCRHLLKGG